MNKLYMWGYVCCMRVRLCSACAVVIDSKLTKQFDNICGEKSRLKLNCAVV